MQEFRVTRPEIYTGNCQGRTDVSARQGHYIKAEVPVDAVKEVAKFFEDLVFDVEVWNGPCEPRNKPISITRWGFVLNHDCYQHSLLSKSDGRMYWTDASCTQCGAILDVDRATKAQHR